MKFSVSLFEVKGLSEITIGEIIAKSQCISYPRADEAISERLEVVVGEEVQPDLGPRGERHACRIDRPRLCSTIAVEVHMFYHCIDIRFLCSTEGQMRLVRNPRRFQPKTLAGVQGP